MKMIPKMETTKDHMAQDQLFRCFDKVVHFEYFLTELIILAKLHGLDTVARTIDYFVSVNIGHVKNTSLKFGLREPL